MESYYKNISKIRNVSIISIKKYEKFVIHVIRKNQKFICNKNE